MSPASASLQNAQEWSDLPLAEVVAENAKRQNQKRPPNQFVIWKGKRLSSSDEFKAFRARVAVRWNDVERIVRLLEDMCLKNKVSFAIVDGNLVDALSKCARQCLKIGDLQACVLHHEDYESAAMDSAAPAETACLRDVDDATIIQTMVRGALARHEYATCALRLKASIMIQKQARRRAATRYIFECLLPQARAQKDERWLRLKERMRLSSRSLFSSDKARIEIHIPSIGLSEQCRLSTQQSFATLQAYQIARLCAAVDQSVHIVYVSPIPLPDEVVDYYRHLIDLGRRTSSQGSPNHNASPFSHKAAGFTIVVPELSHFRDHATLASRALCSPACCRRLKKIACHKENVVIVPAGPAGWAERALALEIDVPLLAPEPASAAACASISGGKRALCQADVSVPLGAHDIYDENSLLVALAKLISSHLEIGRWIIRADSSFSSLGVVAFLDVDDHEVVKELRGEYYKLVSLDEEKGKAAWQHEDVQVLARSRLLRTLRSSLSKRLIVCGESWSTFVRGTLRQYGAVVEAEPRRIIGREAVHAFIRPDGALKILGTQDIVLNQGYDRVAALFPHAKIPHDALVGATSAAARQLYHGQFGAIGYLTLHFVAFYPDEREGSMRLWATELELGMNEFLVGHLIHRTVVRSDMPEDGSYAYFLAPRLQLRAPSPAMSYSTFFGLCRTHGVAFDLEQRTGPLFILFDSLAAGTLGVLAEGSGRREVLESAYKSLMFLRKNVDGPTPPHSLAFARPQFDSKLGQGPLASSFNMSEDLGQLIILVRRQLGFTP